MTGRLTRAAVMLGELRFARFVAIGGLGAGVYAVLSVGLDALGTPLWVSAGVARAVTLAVAFHGHGVYTFGLTRLHGNMAVKFLISRGLNVAYGIGLTYLVVAGLGAAYWVAAAAVIVTTPLVSYPVLRAWVFAGR